MPIATIFKPFIIATSFFIYAMLVSGPTFAASTSSLRLHSGILFNNVMVIDGSGAPKKVQDVLVIDGKIAQLGKIISIGGDEIIDGTGLLLSPGFIDTHSHHDSFLAEYPAAISAVSQGITTIIVGQDGTSQSIDEISAALNQTPAAINLASYTGHGSLRYKVMGDDYKRLATAAEISEMKQLLRTELQQGSFGLSSGLEYDPGIYADTQEVIDLAKVTKAFSGRYMSHMRNEDSTLLAAIDELLMIGQEAQIPVQISHIKLGSIDLWGQAQDVLNKLDAARKTGINVSADIYPYHYWESTLTVLLPERDFNDINAAQYVLDKLAPAAGMTLSSYKENPSLVGKNIAEIATLWDMSEAATYIKLIQDAYKNTPMDTNDSLSQESVIGESMSQADIDVLVAWPHTNLCSDGSRDGHPRGYGAFPRAIDQFVKQRQLLSIEEMIHKMTGLSAQHAGLSQRGLIKVGYPADLVMFDLATIKDNATIAQHDALSTGVKGVWVNGQQVWNGTSTTGLFPGVLIKHSAQK